MGAVAGINVLRSILPRGSQTGRREGGDLENPQASVCIVNHGGDMEIFVDRDTGRQTTRRGRSWNAACWDRAAEKGQRSGMNVDELNGACASFGYDLDAQNIVQGDGAWCGTGWQSDSGLCTGGLVFA